MSRSLKSTHIVITSWENYFAFLIIIWWLSVILQFGSTVVLALFHFSTSSDTLNHQMLKSIRNYVRPLVWWGHVSLVGVNVLDLVISYLIWGTMLWCFSGLHLRKKIKCICMWMISKFVENVFSIPLLSALLTFWSCFWWALRRLNSELQ